jgi:hypothetical protein
MTLKNVALFKKFDHLSKVRPNIKSAYDINDSEIANYDQTHPHYTDKQNTKHYTYFVCEIMCIVFMSGAQLHPSLVRTHYDKKNEVTRTVCLFRCYRINRPPLSAVILLDT